MLTTSVHSRESVAAIRCWVSALTRVDFPDLSLPTMATRGGRVTISPEFFGGFHKLRSALFQGVDGLPEEDCEVADCLFVIRVHDECGGAG